MCQNRIENNNGTWKAIIRGKVVKESNFEYEVRAFFIRKMLDFNRGVSE